MESTPVRRDRCLGFPVRGPGWSVGPAGLGARRLAGRCKLPPDPGATEVALDASGLLRGEALGTIHSVGNHPLPLPRGDVPHARLQPLQIETVHRKVRSTVHSGPLGKDRTDPSGLLRVASHIWKTSPSSVSAYDPVTTHQRPCVPTRHTTGSERPWCVDRLPSQAPTTSQRRFCLS